MNNTAIVTRDASKISDAEQTQTIYTLVGSPSTNKGSATQNIVYIKIPFYVAAGDHLVNFFVKHILKIKNSPAYDNMLQFVYFSHLCAFYLSQKNYDTVIFENRELKEKILLQFDNTEKYRDHSTII